MAEFDKMQEQSNPTLKMLRNSMVMIECLLWQMKTIRSGDWKGLLLALTQLLDPFFFRCKYLFFYVILLFCENENS